MPMAAGGAGVVGAAQRDPAHHRLHALQADSLRTPPRRRTHRRGARQPCPCLVRPPPPPATAPRSPASRRAPVPSAVSRSTAPVPITSSHKLAKSVPNAASTAVRVLSSTPMPSHGGRQPPAPPLSNLERPGGYHPVPTIPVRTPCTFPFRRKSSRHPCSSSSRQSHLHHRGSKTCTKVDQCSTL